MGRCLLAMGGWLSRQCRGSVGSTGWAGLGWDPGDWQGVFEVTQSSSSRNLLANPFNCNCQLAWLGDWLRKRKIVTGNPRCQNPDFLRQIPLQDVAFPDFRCEEGDGVPLGGSREGGRGQVRGLGGAAGTLHMPSRGGVGGDRGGARMPA